MLCRLKRKMHGVVCTKKISIGVLKLRLYLTSVVLSFALLPHDVSAELRPDSLYVRLNRPATVAMHNPPSSFLQSLDRLNQNTKVLAPLVRTGSPFHADVWIIFLEDEEEIGSLPEIIQSVFRALPKHGGFSASRYIEFETEDGVPKAASFQFLGRYKNSDRKTAACRAAVAVYTGVYGLFNDARAQLVKSCAD